VETSLIEAFAGISGQRNGPVNRHDLIQIIVMAVCAVLREANAWVEIAD
jgi:hypothetical protein